MATPRGAQFKVREYLSCIDIDTTSIYGACNRKYVHIFYVFKPVFVFSWGHLKPFFCFFFVAVLWL